MALPEHKGVFENEGVHLCHIHHLKKQRSELQTVQGQPHKSGIPEHKHVKKRNTDRKQPNATQRTVHIAWSRSTKRNTDRMQPNATQRTVHIAWSRIDTLKGDVLNVVEGLVKCVQTPHETHQTTYTISPMDKRKKPQPGIAELLSLVEGIHKNAEMHAIPHRSTRN